MPACHVRLTVLCIKLKSFLWAQNAFLKSLFSMGVQMSEPSKTQPGGHFLLWDHSHGPSFFRLP